MSSASSPSLPRSLSVTKVRLAFECPRLMYLGHHEGGMTMFRAPKTSGASGASGGGIGTAFHQLCDTCVDRMCTDSAIAAFLNPPANQLDPETLAQQIQNQLYTTVFYPYLLKIQQNQPKKVASLMQLWQGLTGLIHRWSDLLASNRAFCEPQDVTRKTFLAHALKVAVKHEFELPNGERQLVSGRFDSLVYDFAAQRLCVVEYKTYQATDPAAQLAQVALYSYMLKHKLKVNINSAVYSVLPDWHGVEYSWNQLEDSLYQLIPQKLQQIRTWLSWQSPNPDAPPMTVHPELCLVCPQKAKCLTYFDGAALSQPNTALPKQKPLDPVSNVDIPPLIAGSVKAGFAIDTSTPVNVELLQVSALQVDSLHVDSLQTQSSDKQTDNNQQTPRPAKTQPAKQPAAKPHTSPKSVSSNNLSAENTAKQLIEVLQAFNVGVDYAGVALGPSFMRVKLRPHLGVRVSSILKFSDDIRVHLALNETPLMAPQAGYISVDLPRPDRQTAYFREYVELSKRNSLTAQIAIGVDLDGQLVEADLSDANTCHFLVGGTTGSGKSEFLRSLLLSLLVRHDPSHLQIALVDPKRVTFPEFETMRWLYEPIVKTGEDAIALMERLVDEMEDRYQRFEKRRCSSLSAYNQQQPQQPLPRIVCIFDEYADFMSEKAIAKALEQSIKRLGAKARAAGIHLIIATQRPEASVVTPLIRSNLPGRVALRTASAADSSIILGSKQDAAVNLLGKGDLFFSAGGIPQRLQSLFAPVETVVEHIE